MRGLTTLKRIGYLGLSINMLIGAGALGALSVVWYGIAVQMEKYVAPRPGEDLASGSFEGGRHLREILTIRTAPIEYIRRQAMRRQRAHPRNERLSGRLPMYVVPAAPGDHLRHNADHETSLGISAVGAAKGLERLRKEGGRQWILG